MCQLSFINLNSKKLNALHLYNQYIANTRFSHKDGCGYFQPGGGIFKCKLAATNITNLGEVIRDGILTKDPVMAHVRLASAGYKTISDENAHPFQQNNLILAHNGTLEPKDPELFRDSRFLNKIDSEIFSILLNEEYEKDFNMPRALVETYKLFWGKFAFIIWSKKEKKYYLARGNSATLFRVDVVVKNSDEDTRIGFVINTENPPLEEALLATSNVYQLMYKLSVAPLGKSVLLKENSIFSFNETTGNVDIIGEIFEERKPYVSTTSAYPAKAIVPVKTIFTGEKDDDDRFFSPGWGYG